MPPSVDPLQASAPLALAQHGAPGDRTSTSGARTPPRPARTAAGPLGSRRALAILLGAVLACASACDDAPPSPAAPADPEVATDDLSHKPVFHDFGVIPHGEIRTAELEIPVPADGPWIPLAFNSGCPCAKQQWVLVDAEGGRRYGDPSTQFHSELIPGPTDTLFLILSIDSSEKDAADLPPNTITGQVIFQRAGVEVFDRKTLPVRFRYGIDAPFTTTPSTNLDIGEIARSQSYGETFVVDVEGRDVEFQAPVAKTFVAGELVVADELTTTLTRTDQGVDIGFRFEASPERPEGPFEFLVETGTDFDGYTLRTVVTGVLRPDISTRPPHRFAFGRIPFGESKSQRVVVEDYDPAHPPGFKSLGIVDRDGEDLSEHFKVVIEPVFSRPRTSTVDVTYDGRLRKHSFRAELLLANREGDEPILRVPVTGFPLPPRDG